MLVEVGHFALILALTFALLQAILPAIGLFKNNLSLSMSAKPLVWGQLFWVGVAFAVLVNAFLGDDFSVKYVANNSNTELPTIFKVSAVWVRTKVRCCYGL